jgi:hypothetical protein
MQGLADSSGPNHTAAGSENLACELEPKEIRLEIRRVCARQGGRPIPKAHKKLRNRLSKADSNVLRLPQWDRKKLSALFDGVKSELALAERELIDPAETVRWVGAGVLVEVRLWTPKLLVGSARIQVMS